MICNAISSKFIWNNFRKTCYRIEQSRTLLISIILSYHNILLSTFEVNGVGVNNLKPNITKFQTFQSLSFSMCTHMYCTYTYAYTRVKCNWEMSVAHELNISTSEVQLEWYLLSCSRKEHQWKEYKLTGNRLIYKSKLLLHTHYTYTRLPCTSQQWDILVDYQSKRFNSIHFILVLS